MSRLRLDTLCARLAVIAVLLPSVGLPAERLDDATRKPVRVGGVRYTIHDGIVYDAPALLADVRQIVADAKAREATAAK